MLCMMMFKRYMKILVIVDRFNDEEEDAMCSKQFLYAYPIQPNK